ncbi:MAG: FecR domain-containing protein [Bacteroidota bacterium]
MIDQNIIEKYLRGELNKEELERFQKYLMADEIHQLEQYMQKDWAERNSDERLINEEISTEMFDYILQSTQEEKVQPRVVYRRQVWMAAASIIFIVLAGFVLNNLFNNADRLIVVYNPDKEAKEINLSDGSKIWLNRHGKVTYYRRFNDSLRTIDLEGEAFFDVAKEQERPFVVNTQNFDIKVLGTSFNLNADEEDLKNSIALVEGKVQILHQDTSLFMDSGEQVTYYTMTQRFSKTIFEGDHLYAWKDGIISLKQAGINEVKEWLEEWYELEVIVEQEELIEGKLVHRQEAASLSLQDVIEIINTSMDYTITIEGDNKARVKPKLKK